MKILHIASFAGNIGDNANHIGMRSRLESVLGIKPDYTELEIRYCYRIYTGSNRWQFDDDFVDIANKHDMIIIGGGNYFEPWLDESDNATTINITNERINKITKPLVFYGVGFDIHKGISEVNLQKFIRFIDKCIEQKNVFLSFRNDGSLKNFKASFPNRKDLWSSIDIVPDGGFFYKNESKETDYLPPGEYLGVNIASDMEELRFPVANDNITWSEFIRELSCYLQSELNQNSNLKIILFPHIYRDVLSIGNLLASLDDRLCRGRVIVAPFACGLEACHHLFALYKKCYLVLGMRFHANVCSIAMGVPAIPLVTYPKLFDLYEEIGFLNRIVFGNKANFSSEIVNNYVYSNDLNVKNENLDMIKKLEISADSFFNKIKQFMSY